jgi:hypothetical protein
MNIYAVIFVCACVYIIILSIIILVFALNKKVIYCLKDVPRLSILLDNYEAIKQEAIAAQQNMTLLKDRPVHSWRCDDQEWQMYFKYLENNKGWCRNHLKSDGWLHYGIYSKDKVFGNAKDCPITTAILKKIGRINMAGFAFLKKGACIPQHVDNVGKRFGTVACNFGLKSSNSYLYVNGNTIQQKERELILFDSTYQKSKGKS